MKQFLLVLLLFLVALACSDSNEPEGNVVMHHAYIQVDGMTKIQGIT